MLKPGGSYNDVYHSFRWEIPELYNIGVDICDKWASQRYRLALIYENDRGQTQHYTFWDLRRLSNQLANGLKAHGINKGDRVAILLPQSPETGISHIAIYKVGAIAVPLFSLFGTDAIEYRLSDCGAKGIITDDANLSKVLEIRGKLPNLQSVISINEDTHKNVAQFWKLIEKGSPEFAPERTRAEDPALIIYTSGTTGPPKGALHAHRVVLGHIPGVEFPHNFFPKNSDLFWTPADWAWIGGLIDVLFPSWHHGIPVVAHRAKKFDPEEAFHLISKYGIQNAFIPPTALRIMQQLDNPCNRYGCRMRSIGSGGETLGEELLDWGRQVMGLTINEFYGQTEVNLVIGSCSEVMETKLGSMGRAIPGHVVELIDTFGNPVPLGTDGEVAIKRPDPVMFLNYWNNPKATKDKYVGDWCLTGDMARKDEDGYFWFIGRKDDVITSSGYRIGPAEVEDCITKHPLVSMAAVVGSPDKVRGEIVKAFVVLKPGVPSGRDIEKEIQNHVKMRLAAHEYPREVEIVKALPMTTTGKIKRKELKVLEINQ